MARSALPLVWLLGLAVVILQALALAARYFQPWLSADYIYPQLFAEDVLAGTYPLAGWTLSSAPYLFPDMLAAFGLRLIQGPGPVLSTYVAVYYAALALVLGWALQRATATGWSAWIGGVVLVNGLLAWAPVADHAHYLWLLGTLGFHGAVMLMGLASFALWAGDPGVAPSPARRTVALALLIPGLFSDTLFLTQALLPLGLMLWLQAGRDWRRPRMRAFLIALALALAAVALIRIGLGVGGWFTFSKVFRYAPLPAAVAGSAARFVRDVAGVIAPDAWAFAALAAFGLGVGGWCAWPSRRAAGMPPRLRLALGWGLLGLAATTLMPIATVYWRSEQHVRYILPWLVYPGWLILAAALPRVGPAPRRGGLAALGAVFVLLGVAAWPQIRSSALQVWPHDAQVERFDAFVRARGLRHGLSDYWRAHELNTESRAGVQLFPLRPTARASFWNNNAFRFYAPGEDGRLVRPLYDFIVTAGLDEAELRRRFGAPASCERVGNFDVWLYAPDAARRLTASMDAEVRAFLHGRPGEDRLPSPDRAD